MKIGKVAKFQPITIPLHLGAQPIVAKMSWKWRHVLLIQLLGGLVVKTTPRLAELPALIQIIELNLTSEL